MRKAIVLLAAAMAAVFGASAAMADAGSNVISRDKVIGSARSCDLAPGRTCYFAFDAVGANSAVFNVPTNTAVACLDADVLLNHDQNHPAQVAFWRVVDSDLKVGGFVPTAAATASLTENAFDCFSLVPGLWWIEVVANQASYEAGAFSLVAITGRE